MYTKTINIDDLATDIQQVQGSTIVSINYFAIADVVAKHNIDHNKYIVDQDVSLLVQVDHDCSVPQIMTDQPTKVTFHLLSNVSMKITPNIQQGLIFCCEPSAKLIMDLFCSVESTNDSNELQRIVGEYVEPPFHD